MESREDAIRARRRSPPRQRDRADDLLAASDDDISNPEGVEDVATSRVETEAKTSLPKLVKSKMQREIGQCRDAFGKLRKTRERIAKLETNIGIFANGAVPKGTQPYKQPYTCPELLAPLSSQDEAFTVTIPAGLSAAEAKAKIHLNMHEMLNRVDFMVNKLGENGKNVEKVMMDIR